jgi:hypothetical protein
MRSAITLMLLAWGTAMGQTRAVVLAPVANLYSSASTDADVVSQARYGMTVTVTQQQEGWLRVKTPGDDYDGWMEAGGLRRLNEGESYATAGKLATVEAMFSHIYREGSVTKHRPLVTVPFETRLEVLAEPETESRRWLQVRLPDDRMGYVQRGDLVFDRPARDVPELIELSKRFLGLPYTWGGTSSFGYDCSGFAQMLVRNGGVSMPRDAKPQALWNRMQVVERAALRPGDLLYFGPSVEKINHTGFYIGNGQFIHSTTNTHPVVQISLLDDQPWTKILVACRRWKQ